MVTELVFDVETKKLFSDIETDDPGDLGVSIVSAYRRKLNDAYTEIAGEMKSFWEKDFDELFSWFLDADRIIGFNTLKFDVPALQPYASYDLKKLKHFDIMDIVRQKIGHRLSLNVLANDTLGKRKTDVGTNAVLYWGQGDHESLKKLQQYCEADVMVTRDLYDFGLKNNYLQFKDRRNELTRINLDFSYPPAAINPQIGLF